MPARGLPPGGLLAAPDAGRYADDRTVLGDRSGRPTTMNILGPAIQIPDWIDSASRYYSQIEGDWRDSVRLMRPPDEVDASDKNPGTLCLHLVASFREVRVLDATGNEEGVIRPRGPGFGYTMRRGGVPVWTVSTRSLVMRRHVLTFSGGDTWDVRTPFFWWMNVVGTHGGGTRVLGQVGPTKRFWLLWVEPGRDHYDLLSALAFMHRRWWRR